MAGLVVACVSWSDGPASLASLDGPLARPLLRHGCGKKVRQAVSAVSGQEQSCSEGSQEDKGMDPCDQPPSLFSDFEEPEESSPPEPSSELQNLTTAKALGPPLAPLKVQRELKAYTIRSSSSEMCS